MPSLFGLFDPQSPMVAPTEANPLQAPNPSPFQQAGLEQPFQAPFPGGTQPLTTQPSVQPQGEKGIDVPYTLQDIMGGTPTKTQDPYQLAEQFIRQDPRAQALYTNPYLIYPARNFQTGAPTFFGRHPAFTNALERVQYGLANMGPPGLSIGENISNAARGLTAYPLAMRERMLQQTMFPLQIAESILQRQKTEAEVEKTHAEARLGIPGLATMHANYYVAWKNRMLGSANARSQPLVDSNGNAMGFMHVDDRGNVTIVDKEGMPIADENFLNTLKPQSVYNTEKRTDTQMSLGKLRYNFQNALPGSPWKAAISGNPEMEKKAYQYLAAQTGIRESALREAAFPYTLTLDAIKDRLATLKADIAATRSKDWYRTNDEDPETARARLESEQKALQDRMESAGKPLPGGIAPTKPKQEENNNPLGLKLQ